jgi:hypothetical protein
MKKLYYLLALVTMAFTACQKQPVVPVPSLTNTATLTFTLAQSDYQLLPSTAYPHSSFSFQSSADADNYIPTILNAKYSKLNNKSTASVTYTLAAPSISAAPITVADSLFKDVAYTVSTADYAAVTGGTFKDLSAAQVISFLKYKYPTPKPNQLAVISYTFYTGSDASVINSFLYLNGAWKKIYQISPAQYTALNLGSADFSASDLPNLPAYFNTFLKADPSIIDTVKTSDIIYVSYKYFVSSANTFQRVAALIYDGNNFLTTTYTPTPVQATGSYLKTNGTWNAVAPVPTVNYTLTAADIKLIGSPTGTIGTVSQRANLTSFSDFESSWASADLNSAMILVLTTDFPTPQVNVLYKVTYSAYVNSADVPTIRSFIYNGTAWVAQQP